MIFYATQKTLERYKLKTPDQMPEALRPFVKSMVEQERGNALYAQTLASKNRLKYAFGDDYKLNQRLWVDRLLSNYGDTNESFYKFIKDEDVNLISDAYGDFCFLNGEIDEAVFKLSRELFFVLFQNREFLYRFNYYMSITERDAFSYGFRLGVQLMAEVFLLPIGEDE